MRWRPGAACWPTGFGGGLAAVCREGRRPGQPSGCPQAPAASGLGPACPATQPPCVCGRGRRAIGAAVPWAPGHRSCPLGPAARQHCSRMGPAPPWGWAWPEVSHHSTGQPSGYSHGLRAPGHQAGDLEEWCFPRLGLVRASVPALGHGGVCAESRGHGYEEPGHAGPDSAPERPLRGSGRAQRCCAWGLLLEMARCLNVDASGRCSRRTLSMESSCRMRWEKPG